MEQFILRNSRFLIDGILLYLLLSPAALGAAGEVCLSRKLHEGLDWMEVRGNCVAALPLFREAAAARNRNLAARAMLYIGYCEERLHVPGARANYARLIREFPDQRRTVAEAGVRLRAFDRVDPSGFRIVASIPVPGQPTFALMLAARAELFVSTEQGVAVIDVRRNVVIHDYPFDQRVSALAAARDGSRVFAAQASGDVRVIDPGAGTVTTLRTRGGPVRDIVASPDGHMVFLAQEQYGLHQVEVATGSDRKLSDRWTAGVALSNNGRTLFASVIQGKGRDTIAWFEAASGAPLGELGGIPYIAGKIALTPDGTQLWGGAHNACASYAYQTTGCPNLAKGVVHVIRAERPKVVRSLGFPTIAGDVITPFKDGSLIAIGAAQSLLFVEPKSFDLAGSIDIEASGSLVFGPEGDTAYAPVPRKNEVVVIKLSR